VLNRSAIIVRPRKPFLDWAAQLDDSEMLPNSEGEQTVYLIPESDGFDIVFESELFAWHTRESDWPQARTFAMFRDWFDIEFHSIVDDLCDFAIENDEGEA
jgi:hypothetical protein